MSRDGIWDVDHVAARRLLSELGIEATPQIVETAARQFASHGRDMMEWGARRAHEQIVRRLDMTAPPTYVPESDVWGHALRYAEGVVISMRSAELLALGPQKARSRGQILRTMLREAREQPTQGATE